MKYLFLGLLLDSDQEAILLAKNNYKSLQPQSCQYQWGMIAGLNSYFGTKVDVLASIPMGTYPFSSSFLFVKNNLIVSRYGVTYVGFINIYCIREKCRLFLFKRKLDAYIKNCSERITLFIYSLYYPFMLLLKWLKRKYDSKVKIVLIVPDLVGREGVQYSNLIKNYVIHCHAKRQYESAKLADSYILLTEHMKYPLKIVDKPYVVIEGFLPKMAEAFTGTLIKYPKKVVLYTGSLNPTFGVEELFEQFKKITLPNYELWICGQEFYTGQIRKLAGNDSRIKYYGFLNKEKVHLLQRQATLLINPRRPDAEYTKYSFPSKTMEYMLSGTPVLMYKLPGIPEAYYPYILFIDESVINGIKDGIIAACEQGIDKLSSFGDMARNYIMTKSDVYQIQLAVTSGVVDSNNNDASI